MARDDDDDMCVLVVGALFAVMIGVACVVIYNGFKPRPLPLAFGIEVRNGLDGTGLDLDWFHYEMYNVTGAGTPGFLAYDDPVEAGDSLVLIRGEQVARYDRCFLHFNGTSGTGTVYQERWLEIFDGRWNLLFVYPEPAMTNISVWYENSTEAVAPVAVPVDEAIEIDVVTSPRGTIWGQRDPIGSPWYDTGILVDFASNVSRRDVMVYNGQDGFGIVPFQYNSTCIGFTIPGISSDGVMYGLLMGPDALPNQIVGIEVKVGAGLRVVAAW